MPAHLVRHQQKRVIAVDAARLDLSDNHSAKIVVLLRDGEDERPIDVAVGGGHAVEVLKERGRGVPGTNVLRNLLFDVGTSEGRDGDKDDILGEEESLLEESAELLLDRLEPLLGPSDSRVVHLVDDNDELGDTSRLDELSVLAGLATLVKTGLEFSLAR